MYVTCLGGNVLYSDNRDGAFTDTTKKAGAVDGCWSIGAVFHNNGDSAFTDESKASGVEYP